ncbi:MAG TPA: APC family permease [Solirubrobacteraceae bacterium]|nr:APC family permease [Solirubrobacteraceae bacterium]
MSATSVQAGPSTGTGPSETPHPELFTRNATGLVRAGNTRSAFAYNVLFGQAGLTLAIAFAVLPLAYPGASLPLALLLGFCLALPGTLVYAYLTTLMPRTGGDYVFVSRTLHPAIGFAQNLSAMLWVTVSFGLMFKLIVSFGVVPLFRMLGAYSGDSNMLSIANWFNHEYAVFLLGAVFILAGAALFIFAGIQQTFRLLVGALVVYAVGVIALPIGISLFTSHASFVHSFNSYAHNLGGPANAGNVVTSAGPVDNAFSFKHSLLLVSTLWFTFGYVFASNYVGGEIRSSRRTHLWSMPGALLASALVMLLVFPFFTHMVGSDFLQQLNLADPSKLGFPGGAPSYPELAAIASGSPILGTIILLAFPIGILASLPVQTLVITRSMLAWSFDGVAPRGLSYVSDRTHAPVVAVIVTALLALGSMAVYAFTTWLSTLSVLVPLAATYFIVAITATVLPYRKPELLASAGMTHRFAGIPALSWLGGLATLGFGGVIAIFLTDPGSGTDLADHHQLLLIQLGILVLAGPALYYVSRWIRARQGVDLDLVYAEIPPE